MSRYAPLLVAAGLCFLARLALPAIAARVQAGAAAEVNTSTAIDIYMCDKMCMQCPDGRNILIQRQKSGKAFTAVAAAGVMSFGFAIPVVNQLASCSHVGFEFWRDRKLQEEQPYRTSAVLGLFFVKGGLEKLQEELAAAGEDADAADREALAGCERLTDVYVWQAVQGAKSYVNSMLLGTENSTGVTPYERQQAVARRCLAHSQLCGQQGVDSTLQANRWIPFVHESMCSEPMKPSMTSQATGEVPPAARGSSDDLSSNKNEEEEEAPASEAAAREAPEEAQGEEATAEEAPASEAAAREAPEEAQGEEAAAEAAAREVSEEAQGEEATAEAADASELAASSPGAVNRDAEYALETIESAGRLLDAVALRQAEGSSELATAASGGGASGGAGSQAAAAAKPTAESLDDVTVGKAANGFCRSEGQKERCLKVGIISPTTCADRCCLDVCKFFGKTIASCTKSCLKEVDFKKLA